MKCGHQNLGGQMTLKEFYLTILRNFADGQPLEYKYTSPTKQKQTKNFPNYDPNKFWTPSQYLKIMKDLKEYQELYVNGNKKRKKTL